MGLISITLPTVGQPNATEDVDIRNALNTIQTVINGNLDTSNLANLAVTAAKIETQQAWIGPIATLNSATGACYYMKDSLGFVWVRWGGTGTFTAPRSAGDTQFGPLPAGYRPGALVPFSCPTGVNTAHSYEITTDGFIRYSFANAGSGAVTVRFPVLAFKAEF